MGWIGVSESEIRNVSEYERFAASQFAVRNSIFPYAKCTLVTHDLASRILDIYACSTGDPLCHVMLLCAQSPHKEILSCVEHLVGFLVILS